MSQKSQISSSESTLLDSKNGNKFDKNVIVCECGLLLEFYIIFQKEYHIIIFPCCSVTLNELNQSSEFRKKCKHCRNAITTERDYYMQSENKTKFICAYCINKETMLKKISNVISKKDISE